MPGEYNSNIQDVEYATGQRTQFLQQMDGREKGRKRTLRLKNLKDK